MTRIIDEVYDPETGGLVPRVVANGGDSGLEFFHELPDLVNHADYLYGASAYAYNSESTPRVFESESTLIRVRPSGLTGGDRARAQAGEVVMPQSVASSSDVVVSVTVLDPGSITGDSYVVRFFNPLNASGSPEQSVVTYDIVDSTSGAVLLDGQSFFATRGSTLPLRENVAVFDGLVFSIVGRSDSPRPPQPGDVYTVDTAGKQRLSGTAEEAVAALDAIQVVPNPYLGASAYEASSSSRVVRFTNLREESALISVFTVRGTLVAVLDKPASAHTVDWDLRTQAGELAASGMYLVHVPVDGVGERFLKLGVVQRGADS